ncbi:MULTISPECIES: hypothetical protein [Halorussus]|uniref:hypothetical protein n=1 Tax=Halorussus TaxID=1070314 RepID=UPI0020A1D27E|nr:hypothetical protein [Halorussus vallis]USZ74703.1 hypothetical protein NGM07_14815 [Halorussus vallis]
MKAGVIGVVDGDFDVVGSFSDAVVEGDRELARRLDVGRVFSLSDGTVAFEGRAAAERLVDGEAARIDSGAVAFEETTRTETRATELAGVPGEFVVAESGAGAFAFEMVGLDTATSVERATLDLNAFLDAQAGATAWKAGFYGEDGNAENGVLHGEDLLADEEFGGVLGRARLNQLGIEGTYRDRPLKLTAARSGYVEVYRPSDFDVGDFLEYVRDEVVPHLE